MNIHQNQDLSNLQSPFKNISLSTQCIQVVLGSLLGDGSLKIQKNYKNARFQIRHSILQKDYLAWKAVLLKEIALPKLQIQKPDGFSKNEKISLQSKALPELTQIHAIVCVNNMLRIQPNWLCTLNATALLIWWLDDGSLVCNGKQGCLCTDFLNLSDQEMLQKYFSTFWDIKVRIGRVTVKNKVVHYRLYFSNTSIRKFFAIVMPKLQVVSMLYKFALRYKDKERQKRWITTMKTTMHPFAKQMDNLYA